jgi:hypothetical protein
MEHYVTLFDSLFLPQGLALHLSMERHAGPYTLWILCMDNEVFVVLQRLLLPNVRLLQLEELETEELVQIKASRTRGEYCWTLTPFSYRFVFDSDHTVERVTYLDADMWFRKNPAQIFGELEASGKHVLISDHAYAPEYDLSAQTGIYCVQFMVFTREGGEAVRKWWEARCLEWCYDRFEDGRFGDQKYLDDWPERFFDQVHVLSDKELLLAPWNATRFPYNRAVCWHFHGLRIVSGESMSKYGVDCGHYPLPFVTRKFIYSEYLSDLRSAINQITQSGGVVKEQKKRSFKSRIKLLLAGYWRQRWRTSVDVYLPL